MLSRSQIATKIEERCGIKPNLSMRIMKELGEVIAEHVKSGEDITVPGVVRISYGYTPARKKGDKYIGFGGEEKTVEKATPEKIRLSVNYPGGKTKLLPKKGTKGYKNVTARKG